MTNATINKILKREYEERGITTCEARIPGVCMRDFALSWHHRHKRRWYKTKDHSREALLASFNQTILVCAACHDRLEQHPDETREYFERLRGKGIMNTRWFWVDEKKGKDTNDGLSPDTALKDENVALKKCRPGKARNVIFTILREKEDLEKDSDI